MRQIMGVFSQLEKTRLVKKLKAARDRKRNTNGKVEGRKSHAELRPEVVAEARRLARASPKTGERRSLRKIAKELAELGHINVNGHPYSAKSIRSMIDGPAGGRQRSPKRVRLPTKKPTILLSCVGRQLGANTWPAPLRLNHARSNAR
jgi:hypothetical protein